MNNVPFIAIAVLSVMIASFSQVLLKRSAQIKYSSRIREYINPYVLSGYSLLIVSTLLTIMALRVLSIQDIAMIEGISYLFVMILDRVALKEKITKGKIVGNLFIITGIICFYL
jgi:uncharacterized membrane protein